MPFIFWGEMAIEIPLSRGLFALIDEEDYMRISQYKWCALKRTENLFYAVRTDYSGGRKERIYMHRFILNPPQDFIGEHKNGNGLDNRRENLRIATQLQNRQNQRPRRNKKTSIYKGVYFRKKDRKWVAQIKCPDKAVYLGCFTSEIEAAKAYDRAAHDFFGEFALCNFQPHGGSREI